MPVAGMQSEQTVTIRHSRKNPQRASGVKYQGVLMSHLEARKLPVPSTIPKKQRLIEAHSRTVPLRAGHVSSQILVDAPLKVEACHQTPRV